MNDIVLLCNYVKNRNITGRKELKFAQRLSLYDIFIFVLFPNNTAGNIYFNRKVHSCMVCSECS